MDYIMQILLVVGTLFLVGIAFLIGRWFDSRFKVRMLRKFTKQNWGLLDITDTDRKTSLVAVVNFAGSSPQVDGHKWIIDKGDIYREDQKEKGFKIMEDVIRWEEGVPIIRVDRYSLRPLSIEGTRTNVKPDEISAILSSYLANERAKIFAGLESQINTLVMVCIVVGLISAGVSYMNGTAISDLKTMENQTRNDLSQIKTAIGISPNINTSQVIIYNQGGYNGK